MSTLVNTVNAADGFARALHDYFILHPFPVHLTFLNLPFYMFCCLFSFSIILVGAFLGSRKIMGTGMIVGACSIIIYSSLNLRCAASHVFFPGMAARQSAEWADQSIAVIQACRQHECLVSKHYTNGETEDPVDFPDTSTRRFAGRFSDMPHTHSGYRFISGNDVIDDSNFIFRARILSLLNKDGHIVLFIQAVNPLDASRKGIYEVPVYILLNNISQSSERDQKPASGIKEAGTGVVDFQNSIGR